MESRERVLSMINAAWMCQAIASACELKLPDHLARGPRDAGELAAATATDANCVARLLRALVTLDLCEEHLDGTFTLTGDGELLRSDAEQSLHGWARMSGTRLWNNWAQLAESVRTGQSVRKRVLGADDFSPINDDAAASALFNRAMADLTRPVALAAAEQLDWSTHKLLVDVGSGPGELIATILEHHVHLKGIAFDLDHAVAPAQERLRRSNLTRRCEVVAGSFFEGVPPGADTYLLKSVLHNWPDESAMAILARCREAMAPEGTVILFERVVPERYTSSNSHRDIARSDLNMLVGCDGCERTEAQFRSMFAAAGFDLARVSYLAAEVSALEARRLRPA